MFQCHVCGHREARAVHANEVFRIDGRLVLVEHIPAQECAHCGERVFSREAAEAVRRLVHSPTPPTRAIEMPVFEFA